MTSHSSYSNINNSQLAPPVLCDPHKTDAAIRAVASVVGRNAMMALLTRTKSAVEARADVDTDGDMVRHIISLLAAALPLREGDLATLVSTTARSLRQHRIARGSYTAAKVLFNSGSVRSANAAQLAIPPPPSALVSSLAALQLCSMSSSPCAFAYNIIMNCERALAEPVPVPSGANYICLQCV